MARKKQSKVTKAGAVVLEESQLDQARGGGVDIYVKVPDIRGEAPAKRPPGYKS